MVSSNKQTIKKNTMPVLTKTTEKKTTSKTVSSTVTSLWVVFNLPLHYGDIQLFREAILHCIKEDQERIIVSNEDDRKGDKEKNISTYPVVQFRCHQQKAAIFAIKQGVHIIEKFLLQYCHADKRKTNPFPWNGDKWHLQDVIKEKENNFEVKLVNPKLRIKPVVYRLHAWLPFSKDNYENWWKPNRNLSDTEKTKKLEQILTGHLCAFIQHTGGYIPRHKFKLSILDKDRLKKIFYKEVGQVAFDIRYTVNLLLPERIGLGNHPAFGFGWQKLETE